jgi:LacI family transcriptional regulator/LacI family repressor for deo operon, udp, cdd, tsx, nupC, and nupG
MTAHDRAQLGRLGPFLSTFAAGVSVLPAVLEARAMAVVPYATAIGLGLMFALGDRPSSCRAVVNSERMVVDSLGLVGVPARESTDSPA